MIIVIVMILSVIILHVKILNPEPQPLKESVLFLATFILYLPFMAIATRSVHVTTQRVDGCCSLMYGPRDENGRTKSV